ncbi:MAG: T9SS type A sorting domain-containing protein [Bacteroidales bacterium]|nr:T9SS type A sorting domain-containing protein [Bacteroidales bacterium]
MNLFKFAPFLTFFLSLLISRVVFGQSECSTAGIPIYSDTIKAIHYGIHLDEIDMTSKSIKGYTTALLTSKINGISSIKLELDQLIVDSVFVDNQRSENFERTDLLVIIPLAEPISAGDTLEVGIYYHGQPMTDPSGWGGFHFAGDYAFNLGVGFETIPHNLGKAWFPCIDDFRDRALYDVYIRTPNDKTGVSGGTLVEVIPAANDTHIFHWKTDKSLPTYLISASIGKYNLVNDIYNGINGAVPITFYCRPTDESKVAATFINLKDILQIFENHFGEYPFERVGYTATSQGAMEHAANISYPYAGWNGATSQEWWYAHELSHMWFGDMVTCASAEDMWLNEGWAVWCESLYKEFLYGPAVASEYTRTKLKAVILSTHFTDGGYFPVYGIPQELTYGNTVYEKGAQVTHTLRHYLGDSLFFAAVKAYLQEYAYQPASSCQLRDFLSDFTQVNMDDFFDAWVFSPGFPTFSVSYFEATPENQGYKVEVQVAQKLRGRETYANSNHLELEFLGANWEKQTDTIIFSGKTGIKTFYLPFNPVAVIPDPDAKISDAALEYEASLKAIGEKDFADTYARVNVTAITDSAYIRIIHNWVAPDSLKVAVGGLRLSDNRYWKVDGIIPAGFRAKGKFTFSRSNNFDINLLTSTKDSLVILYRRDSKSDWYGVPFTRQGNAAAGQLIVDSLAVGEYTLAVYDKTYGFGESITPGGYDLKVFPNPTTSSCTVAINNPGKSVLRVFDLNGRKIEEHSLEAGNHVMNWEQNSLPSGIYVFRLYSGSGQIKASRKMILN